MSDAEKSNGRIDSLQALYDALKEDIDELDKKVDKWTGVCIDTRLCFTQKLSALNERININRAFVWAIAVSLVGLAFFAIREYILLKGG